MAADIVAESRRKPVVRGETGVEIGGNLINQVHVKNAALRRAVVAHEECRR